MVLPQSTPAKILIAIILCAFGYVAAAESPRMAVDDDGVLRWKNNNQEVALFGVNYCFPSGYGFRVAGLEGVDRKSVVDADMQHLARMGLDGLRLSFWGDWENTDRQGNLVDNEHLDLLDYTIAKASERGICILLTPIVLYSPVWPQPEETNTCQGFPRFYPKNRMGIDPDAIKAQTAYLTQLMNHVNRYTKRAYKDEPAIAIVEPINEPYHHPDNNPVGYINALVNAVKDTGYAGPVVFNVSQDMAIAAAIRDSLADGATFGWYPSGLVNGVSMKTNFLPRVDDYRLTYDPILKNKAKLVYEFDAADVPGSYMYPAMARTYRSGGVQFAAMFSYDPLALAARNLEYQTHYLNLVYTPNKAVSLVIAAEAFRQLPRMQTYGRYPQNTRFGPIRVNFEQDFSELVSDTCLMYSNTTQSLPPAADKLERVIGCGSSPVVQYEGTGAYFVEKLRAGTWRLEVYPDAVRVADPHGRPSRDREVSRLIHRQRTMRIALPDLGSTFSIAALNTGNAFTGQSKDGQFIIAPGVYLLKKEGIQTTFESSADFGRLKLGEFIVPSQKHLPVQVTHAPPRELIEGQEFKVEAVVASNVEPQEVRLAYRLQHTMPFKEIPMQKATPYHYAVSIPKAELKMGQLQYAVIVRDNGQETVFPGQTGSLPKTARGISDAPLVLYKAVQGDPVPSVVQWSSRNASAEVAGDNDKGAVLRVRTEGFDANGSVNVTVPLELVNQSSWNGFSRYDDVTMVLSIRAVSAITTQLEMVLTDRFNMTHTVAVPLETDWRQHSVLLRDVCAANLVSAKLTIGAWLYPGYDGSPCGFELESISVLPPHDVWQSPVLQAQAPFVLLDAAADHQHLIFPNSEHKVAFSRSMTKGLDSKTPALRVDVPTFRYSPHDVSFRRVYGSEIDARRPHLGQFSKMHLRVRAAAKETSGLEVSLIGQNGCVRSAEVPLTTDWRDAVIPLTQFAPGVVTFLPRPYPTQFDYWDQDGRINPAPFELSQLEALQISFGSRLFPKHTDTRHAIEIERVWLTVD